MRVSDVISSKGNDAIFTVRPDAPISELLDTLAEHNVGALVVSEDGETLSGIVSERDVVRKLRGIDKPNEQPVSSIMTAAVDLRTCSPTDSFGQLMSLMTEHRVRHVPVLDEDRLIAVVSIGDAVKYRMDKLEFERDQLNEYVASAQ